MLTPISPASANSRASSPGWSGTATNTTVAARAGPPCLPGITAVPATPRSSSRAERGPVAVGQRVEQRVEVVAHVAQQVA